MTTGLKYSFIFALLNVFSHIDSKIKKSGTKKDKFTEVQKNCHIEKVQIALALKLKREAANVKKFFKRKPTNKLF